MSEVVESVEIGGGVLVGHDGSAAASEAVRYAADLAVKLGHPLHVLRAWGLTTAPTPRTAALGVPPLTDFEAAVRDDLRDDVAGLQLPGEVELHVVHGRAAHALLAAAEHADLLVVGRRGGGGFRGLGFGSTADQVVRNATCPVLTVPVHPADD